jgi:hypothetical protein
MGEPFEMDVERGKIRELARAVHAPEGAYDGPQPPVPPTFLTVARLWEPPGASPWPSAGLDPRRVLHAEQEYVFHGAPPRAGQRLRCQSRVEDVTVKEGRRGPLTFAVMVTEFRSPDGRLVAESRMTGVQTPETA